MIEDSNLLFKIVQIVLVVFFLANVGFQKLLLFGAQISSQSHNFILQNHQLSIFQL
jgi:hypothetical protein